MAIPIQHNLEEVRAEANIVLKVVDQCIKAGLLDEAKDHLEKARMIDPSNVYIYAFQERIAFLKEERSKKNSAISNREALEAAAREKLETNRRRAEEERLKKETEWRQKKVETEKQQETLLCADAAPTLQEPVSIPKISEKPAAIPSESRRKPENTTQQKVVQPSPQQIPTPAVPTTVPAYAASQDADKKAITSKGTNQAYDMYKRVLMLAWADGAVSQEELSQLQDLRTTLRISMEEHAKLEQEAKEESYSHAFTLVWSSGMNLRERSAVINELRQKYQISPEAHSRIETKVLAEFGTPQDKPMIYIIDDDENILGMILRVLEAAGFSVKAFNTSDEALTGLKNEVPDLIISDINLETSTIGGFTFYEKVRQLSHLSHMPFIFLSGITDEGMIRYGKGLGVDDYITKPFSGDMLIDVVKGKLKRYKQLKHN